jgi:lysophospholipase L1-like esterase
MFRPLFKLSANKNLDARTQVIIHCPDIQVTLGGDVAMLAQVVNGNQRSVYVSLMSGVTGEALYAAEFAPPGGNYVGYAPNTTERHLAITRDRVYVALSKCQYNWWSCGYDDTLYALDFPGMELDYPSGAILWADEPWLDYVAMGDSFSSGQGVSPYEAGTDTEGPPENRCRRSESAYARLLDGYSDSRLNLTAFVACGGSETSHIINGRFDEDPQLDALSEDTDIVTITIGGNNIGFSNLATECVKNNVSDCTDSVEYLYTRVRLDSYLASELDTLYFNLSLHIDPQARVLVVGYPEMIPDPAINTLPNCPYLTQGEKITAQDVIEDLNQVIQDEVSEAGAQFEYVDPNEMDSPFIGHELCMDNGYFNGLDLNSQDESLHPNIAGQDAYRRIITAYLIEHP